MSFRPALPSTPAAFSDRDRWRFAEVWPHIGPGRDYGLRLGALVLAYYVAAQIGYAFQFSGPVAAIVWLPVGVGIAFLYLGGMRFWPGVVIGDLLVNNYSALPVGSALVQSFGNLIEVVVAAALIRRLCPRDRPISTVRGVAGIVAAIAFGTLLSATVGTLSSLFGSVIQAHSAPHVWRTWWLGDFSGALVVVPLVLAWSSLPARPWPWPRALEAALMVAVVAGLSAVLLGHNMMLCVVVFPALIWAALSFGVRGATLAIVIICGFAIWGATNDLGPFGVGSINSRLLETQLFIATVSLSGLAIAALVSERWQLVGRLNVSRARLVEASDEARHRIERDLHDGAQQSLLGLQLKLDLAADAIREDPPEGERQVRMIERQMDAVLHDLRSIAQGAYPPLLRNRGVVDALKSAARLTPVDVSVRSEAVRRYSRAVEATVYFCCLEAMQNVTKHAGQGVHAEVRLRQRGRQLQFEIIDSGLGFDARATSVGDGLANIRDRLEAVGGTLTVVSWPGRGTTIRGHVPVA